MDNPTKPSLRRSKCLYAMLSTCFRVSTALKELACRARPCTAFVPSNAQVLTCIGLALVLTMISGQLVEFLSGKKNTHARLEASLGLAYPLKLR